MGQDRVQVLRVEVGTVTGLLDMLRILGFMTACGLVALAIVNHRQIADGVREFKDWWRARRHPLPVASGQQHLADEEIWANPLSVGQLSRRWRRYKRLTVKGKLRGEHLVRARAVRAVLVRRVKSDAADAAYVNERTS